MGTLDLRLVGQEVLNERRERLPGNTLLGSSVAQRHNGCGEGFAVVLAVERDGVDVGRAFEEGEQWAKGGCGLLLAELVETLTGFPD